MSGKLFVVGTPIGNLGDFSPRAVEVLRSVDFIAAEDTRVTLKLCNRFEIKKPMISYHEHNKMSRHGEIINEILKGKDCALVSDAGMPAISDPGEDLVRLCRESEIPVESVPGPSALITALAISGMPSERFCFEGFLPAAKTERRERLLSLSGETRTMIFYEAPHRLASTLEAMAEVFGDRETALVKELTKIHETVERTTICAAAEKYRATPPKGEFVVIVGGAPEQPSVEFTFEEACDMAKRLLSGGASMTAAAKQAACETGFRKNEIYKALIK